MSLIPSLSFPLIVIQFICTIMHIFNSLIKNVWSATYVDRAAKLKYNNGTLTTCNTTKATNQTSMHPKINSTPK